MCRQRKTAWKQLFFFSFHVQASWNLNARGISTISIFRNTQCLMNLFLQNAALEREIKSAMWGERWPNACRWWIFLYMWKGSSYFCLLLLCTPYENPPAAAIHWDFFQPQSWLLYVVLLKICNKELGCPGNALAIIQQNSILPYLNTNVVFVLFPFKLCVDVFVFFLISCD